MTPLPKASSQLPLEYSIQPDWLETDGLGGGLNAIMLGKWHWFLTSELV